ncbi:MAG: response regulator transcription factor [Myxococcota bacterium]
MGTPPVAPECPGSGRVAIVDDEPGVRDGVALALGRSGYRVERYADGESAWEAFAERLPDLAILDILMPGIDGLELCRRLRARSRELPIIFLSSRDEEFDRVLGLEVGADDYLGKPFSSRELMARVRVLFRRLDLTRERAPRSEAAEKRLQIDALELDLQRYTVAWNEREVALTVTEFLLLRSLVARPGVVKTRLALMEEAYPHDGFVSERTIDSHIKRIRRKFEGVEPDFAAIETVHGLGYRYRVRRAPVSSSAGSRRIPNG